MNNPPAISVVMPVFNGARWLPDSLASIQRQEVPGIEIVLIDDGSTDDSTSVARAAVPGLRCFRQENRGQAAARNAGVKEARGILVAFLDQDDVWPDGSLAVRVNALQASPAALFVLGRTRFLRSGTAPEPWVATNLGAGLYRRELFGRAGLFNEDCRLTDDIEWFLRIRESGLPYVTLPQETLHYRRDTGGITHGRSWRDPELAATVRASLARRRQAGATAGELPLLSGSKNDPRATGPVNHANPRRQAD